MTGKSGEINQLTLSDASPEKVGVGGSIPSLATMFSVTCRTALPPTYSISFPIP